MLDDKKAPQPQRNISLQERALLIDLFRKQRDSRDISCTIIHLPVQHALLAKLILIMITYCANEFCDDDWDFALSQLKFYIHSAVVVMENVAENVDDLLTNSSTCENMEKGIRKKLESIVLIKDNYGIDIAKDALLAFRSFCYSKEAERTERWGHITDRIVEGILRAFLCVGLAEAMACMYSLEAAAVIPSSLLSNVCFWKLVAWGTIHSSPLARERAAKSIDLWGLTKGSIDSLYAILFSSKPETLLQFAAYVFLSSEPVSVSAVQEGNSCGLDSETDTSNFALLSEPKYHIKQEISSIIQKQQKTFDLNLLAPERVCMFNKDSSY